MVSLFWSENLKVTSVHLFLNYANALQIMLACFVLYLKKYLSEIWGERCLFEICIKMVFFFYIFYYLNSDSLKSVLFGCLKSLIYSNHTSVWKQIFKKLFPDSFFLYGAIRKEPITWFLFIWESRNSSQIYRIYW